jgi:hypothetical protein
VTVVAELGERRPRAATLFHVAVDLHRLAELRSLAYHEEISLRLPSEVELLDRARRRLDDWLSSGAVAMPYVMAWRDVLSRSIPEIIESLRDPGERMTALRHCTPFAGALDPRERWRVWRRVRSEYGAHPASR